MGLPRPHEAGAEPEGVSDRSVGNSPFLRSHISERQRESAKSSVSKVAAPITQPFTIHHTALHRAEVIKHTLQPHRGMRTVEQSAQARISYARNDMRDTRREQNIGSVTLPMRSVKADCWLQDARLCRGRLDHERALQDAHRQRRQSSTHAFHRTRCRGCINDHHSSQRRSVHTAENRRTPTLHPFPDWLDLHALM